jgi:hypothetical protein
MRERKLKGWARTVKGVLASDEGEGLIFQLVIASNVSKIDTIRPVAIRQHCRLKSGSTIL